MTLFLASQSPRRRELLTQMGVVFDVLDVSIDETPAAGEPALDYVRRVAREKPPPLLHRNWRWRAL